MYRQNEFDKSIYYIALEPLFATGKIQILDHAEQARELRLLERRPRPGGKIVIDHPRNSHDDYSNSLAIAVAFAKKSMMVMGVPMAVGGRVASIPFGSTFTQAPPGGSTFAPRYWTEDDDDPPSGAVLGARIRGY